jgi:hypothetical protein
MKKVLKIAAVTSLLLTSKALVWGPGRSAPYGQDSPAPRNSQQVAGLRVGAAAEEFQADDSMVIGGGIEPGKAQGQEGKLRAVAVVAEKPPFGKLGIVSCDVLMLTRDLLDPVAAEIERTTGIPRDHILISATHTHHAPSTVTVHGYERDETFCRRVQRGIVIAVQEANGQLAGGECRFYFHLGQEGTVGQNSRLLLSDNTIYWIGPRGDAVRPTGPFDPGLPVLAFRDSTDRLRALIFNHSTHSIGTRCGKCRSPSFYGLAAQEMEEQLGGTVCFLEGASGSTHNLELSTDTAVKRIEAAVQGALSRVELHPVTRLQAVRQAFKFKVRSFNEAQEDAMVSSYCKKRAAANAPYIIEVFRKQRRILAPLQGQDRETWLQVMAIGDVAIVGVPGEFFTGLGKEIKRRSPFRYTYIAELANDWIGYLPDEEAFRLGGYQTWTGLHSYSEPGTGERIVDESVKMLKQLADAPVHP